MNEFFDQEFVDVESLFLSGDAPRPAAAPTRARTAEEVLIGVMYDVFCAALKGQTAFVAKTDSSRHSEVKTQGAHKSQRHLTMASGFRSCSSPLLYSCYDN